MKKWIVVPIFLLLVGSSILLEGAHGFEPVELTDDENDVERTRFLEEEVEGFGDIDIVSLVSVDEISTITVTLTVKGSINSGDGYEYDIWMGFNYVEYYNGEFDIEEDIEDDTEAEVSGSSIVITIQRNAVIGDYWDLSADTYYFDMSAPMGWMGGDMYQDMAGEDPWGGTRQGVNDHNVEIIDEEGDVVRSYSEVEEVDTHPYIDIVSLGVAMNGDGDYIVTLELAGTVMDDFDVMYDIEFDDASITYSNGEGWIYYYDSEDESEEVVKDGNSIIATLDGSLIDGTGNLYASADFYPMDSENNEYYTDSLSDSPFDDDLWEMLFLMGFGDMEMVIEFEFQDVDEMSLRVSMEFGDGLIASLLRSSLDADEDGKVESVEIEEIGTMFEQEDLEEGFLGLDVIVDDQTGEKTFSAGWEGLLGDVESMESISMYAEIEYSFTIEEADKHTIVLRPTDNYSEEEGYIGDDGPVEYEEEEMDLGFNMTFRIVMPDGWKIVLSSVQPSFMSGFVNDDRSVVELDQEDIDLIGEPDGDVISFDITYEGGGGDDDDSSLPVEGGIGAILIGTVIFIVVVLLIVIASIVLLRRRKD